MADHHFARARSWPELVSAHSRWVEEYNAQYHAAHEKRPDGRRTPAEVLGQLTLAGVRYRQGDLDRAFFSERFSRVLDALGYVVWRRWRVYGEEGLAGKEAALWLRDKTLTIEHGGEPLSRYEVEFTAGTEKPRALTHPLLFESTVTLSQRRLFGLDSLGEVGWLKTLRLEDYAARRFRPESLQQALFAYHEAWG